MKSLKIYYIAALCALGVSCNDAFLDRYPMDDMTDENFWQTEEHVRSVVNTFTSSLRGKDWLNMTEAMADSAPWAVPMGYRTIGGGNYATDIGQINTIWVNCYTFVGRTNYFLNNYHRAVKVSDEVKARFAAEAYFYRAFNYWLLTNYFGDVPYITKELNVEDPDVFRGRDKRSEIIDAITKELEDHYLALPEHIDAGGSEFGYVSQTTALALLSRIYLYNERWAEAVDAAERAMSSPYYKLYSTGKPAEDYMNLFTYTGRASRNANNHETLLAYIYNYNLGEDARTSHNLSRELWVPNDYARFVPTKTMIESYLTADGKIWDPSTITSYEQIFENRDPRMTQSILPPNTPWEGGIDGDKNNTDRKMFKYPLLTNSKTGCCTYTGYYLRKYVEPSTVKDVGHDDNDIIMFRFAEVLLNYVEAKEQLGGLTQDDLDKTINLLRDRVGMDHLELSNLPAGSDIRAEIRRERRVELFMEGHRYFDIIRWKQGELLGQDLLGVNRKWIDASRVNVDLDKQKWATVGGEQFMVLEEGRQFVDPKHYLLSLPFKQTQLNPNLNPNNPGW